MKKLHIMIAVLLLSAVTVGCGSETGQSAASKASSAAPAKTDKPKETKPAEPQATVAQKNAVAPPRTISTRLRSTLDRRPACRRRPVASCQPRRPGRRQRGDP